MSAQTIKQFADKHRLRVVTDKGDGTPIILGRHGHLYEYDAKHLGVIYLSQSVGKANNRRKECEKLGMVIIQDGDTEFAAAFLLTDAKQAKLAVKIAGCKAKREMSEAQKNQFERVKAAGSVHRFEASTAENSFSSI